MMIRRLLLLFYLLKLGQGQTETSVIVNQRASRRAPKNYLSVKDVPSYACKNFTFTVKYSCKKPSVIAVFLDGYADDDTLFRNSSDPHLLYDPDMLSVKHWPCRPSPVRFKRKVKLKLPPGTYLKPDVENPKAVYWNDIKLKALSLPTEEIQETLENKDFGRTDIHTMYDTSTLKLNVNVKLKPAYERSSPEMSKSNSWKLDILATLQDNKILTSEIDEECYTMIDFPTVLPEEPYGIIQALTPYRNEELRYVSSKSKTRFSFTTTLFLMSWCKKAQICGIFHHMNSDELYTSPSLLLSENGRLHIQMQLANNQSAAHLTPWTVPTMQWVKINWQQANSMMNISMYYGDNFQESKHFDLKFDIPIYFDDMDGHVAYGGSVWIRSANALVTKAKFCRNKHMISEDEMDTSYRKLMGNIENAIMKDSKLQQIVKRSLVSYQREIENKTDVCVPYFLEVISQAGHTNDYCEEDNVPLTSKYEKLANIDTLIHDLAPSSHESTICDEIAELLHNQFLTSLDANITSISDNIKLLKQSANLGHGASHFYLYVIYKNGYGTKRNMVKARYHLLKGASLCDRMSLKSLGFNFLEGLHGFPKNIDLSIYYYFIMAHLSQKDLIAHKEDQTHVNTVRLTDEEAMKQQTSEEEDLFHWLKLQATNGVYSAQRNMGQLLYWGQKGVQRNLEAAFKYYEEAAATGDDRALYDYGLVLLRGHGTEQNDENDARGVEALERAVEQDNPQAMNTLGWYYSVKDVNFTKATEYYERADELGSIDATYNLGHLYHKGDYPGTDGKDIQNAFIKYFSAGRRGHIESCLQLSRFYRVGIKNFLGPNKEFATQWARYLCDMNPEMGEIIRKGLQAYRNDYWLKALFLYLAVAESGMEVATFNTAHLCEQDHFEWSSIMEEECVWRFWNISAHFPRPHPHSLNKMGDYHYYGHSGDINLKHALKWYGKAADLKHPQSIFNIAAMLEDHSHRISTRDISAITDSLQISNATNHDEIIVQLYRLCSTSFQDELGFPCYLGLLRKTMSMQWNSIPTIFKFAIAITMAMSMLVIGYTYKEYMENQQHSRMNTEDLLVLEDGADSDNVDGHLQTNEDNLYNPVSNSALTNRPRSRIEVNNEIGETADDQSSSPYNENQEIDYQSIPDEAVDEEDKKDQ